MKKILISEDTFGDLNEGFLFYEAQEFGLGDYFTACLRSDIEGLKVSTGIHREVQGFHRLWKLSTSRCGQCLIYAEIPIGYKAD